MIDMGKNFNLSDCANEDIISFGEFLYRVGNLRRILKDSGDRWMGQQLSHKLQSLSVKIDDDCFRNGKAMIHERLFHPGIDCEILAVGAKEWKKGKVKIKMSFEFYLEDDESDENSTLIEPSEIKEYSSPLDDLREELKKMENPE